MTRPAKTLIVSEYLPFDPDRMVHGVFQRLRRHIEALDTVGSVDFIFLWPLHWFESEDRQRESIAAFRRSWSIAGEIVLISPPARATWFRRWLERLDIRDLIAATRGAISFINGRPTMRSCRRAEVHRLEQAIASLNPDLIFAHRLSSTAALIRMTTQPAPVLVDFDDLEHVAVSRSARAARSSAGRLRLRLAAWLARWTETVVARYATVGLVCSEHDRNILRDLAPGARIEIAPNTALVASPLPIPFEPTALFVGYARYRPNAEAILWLVEKVFPIVRASLPQARLVIAGLGSSELGIGEEPGVELLSFVPDLAPAYAAARLVVCPIRRGGGTRIKIIEAALYGRPVVSTALGAEGLDFIDGREVVIADKEEDFAQAMIELMSNHERAASIGAAAADRASRLYGADKVRADLAALASSLILPDIASERDGGTSSR